MALTLAIKKDPKQNAKFICNRLLFDNMLQKFLDDDTLKPKKLAQHLFYLFRSTDKMRDLLDYIFKDIDPLKLQQQINTVHSHLLKRITASYGRDFLKICIIPFYKQLDRCRYSLEVDPDRVKTKSSLKRHQRRLLRWCDSMWEILLNQARTMPLPVKQICRILRDSGGFSMASGYFFLRFFNPALSTPSLLDSGIKVSTRTRRHLTLIAKVLQLIANGLPVVCKMPYMAFTEKYVTAKIAQLPDVFGFTDHLTPRSAWRYTKSDSLARVSLTCVSCLFLCRSCPRWRPCD